MYEKKGEVKLNYGFLMFKTAVFHPENGGFRSEKGHFCIHSTTSTTHLPPHLPPLNLLWLNVLGTIVVDVVVKIAKNIGGDCPKTIAT